MIRSLLVTIQQVLNLTLVLHNIKYLSKKKGIMYSAGSLVSKSKKKMDGES